jgi:lipopolysaccharide/colanic/teichoic acid biosynthesis glycosyltransferase
VISEQLAAANGRERVVAVAEQPDGLVEDRDVVAGAECVMPRYRRPREDAAVEDRADACGRRPGIRAQPRPCGEAGDPVIVAATFCRVNRVLDVAIAGAGLVVSSPVLALAAIAVKLDDGGPVFYRQTRVGKDGVDFELLKLRTMVVGAETLGAGPAVNRGDARITRAGRALRRLSIDELPQLWNVVKGDMSVIGPRPTLRYQVDQYDERQRRRLDVKPGITGWAQIHGRAALPWAERIELDLWYVRNRSPRTDLLILLRTPLALFGGTYKGETGGW